MTEKSPTLTTEEIEARISQLDRAIADTDRYLNKLRAERVDLKLLLNSRRPRGGPGDFTRWRGAFAPWVEEEIW